MTYSYIKKIEPQNQFGLKIRPQNNRHSIRAAKSIWNDNDLYFIQSENAIHNGRIPKKRVIINLGCCKITGIPITVAK
ncbi:MAG: hypothetical protein DRR16_19595 [Candidatus Parabeggiatoa sp. nov. 3]|nr:MAG: hypothetical protein DRR00_06635 [Gammaproteobacteria bacterium]RKZ66379.1 MAG: hypothetical protein DRQ99_09825 [Gammaproteobacteria bacterium]RKZ82463.1 MAG: hypothetical protein DRR16_19595 [Gammaproteobacteria bacterium]